MSLVTLAIIIGIAVCAALALFLGGAYLIATDDGGMEEWRQGRDW